MAYNQFSVDLIKYVDVLITSKDSSQIGGKRKALSNYEARVSCIQVCRNHARSDFKYMLHPKQLRWMYEAGCGHYCFQNCKAVDILLPIRIACYGANRPDEDKKSEKFIPMLVSVKTRKDFTPSEVKASFTALTECLKNSFQNGGLCVLLLIGLDSPGDRKSGWYNEDGKYMDAGDAKVSDARLEDDTKINKDSVTVEDICNGVTRLLISVPEDDQFGLWDATRNSTTGGDVKAEIFSSHSFLHGFGRIPKDTKNPGKLLLRSKPHSSDVDYCNNLVRAFSSGTLKIASGSG